MPSLELHAAVIETLKAGWRGPEALVPVEPHGVASLEVDALSQAVLLGVGLPAEATLGLRFGAHRSGEVPRVSSPTAEGGHGQARLAHLRIIGACGSGPICLDEKNDGEVVVLDVANDFHATLMNSSVASLVRSLAAHAGWSAKRPRLPSTLVKVLKAADAAAFTSGAFWYRVAVAQSGAHPA